MNKRQKQAVEELIHYVVAMTEGGEEWADDIREDARIVFEMLTDENVKSYVEGRVKYERAQAKENGRKLLESAVPDFRKRVEAYARENLDTWDSYVGRF